VALLAAEQATAPGVGAFPSKYEPGVDLQIIKGRAYLGLGRYREALAVYQDITGPGKNAKPGQKDTSAARLPSRSSRGEATLPGSSSKTLAEAYYGAGEAYLGLGENQPAEVNFQRAADLKPDWDKPRRALERLSLQEVSGRIYGYWVNTKPENFTVKLRGFADWAKKQEFPGGKKLTLYYSPVEGNYPKNISFILLADWAAAGGFASGVQAHGIYWFQDGRLKSQVLYSVDAFNHGLDQSRATLQARTATKVDRDGGRYPELGVVYDGAYGGSGSPRPVFYLWRLQGDCWQALWRSDENHFWRNSHGKLNFTGPGMEEFTLESDSWLVNDGKDTIFHESNPGPHRHFLDTWRRENDHFERKEARTLPSAYNTLVELVSHLRAGQEQEAAKLATREIGRAHV